MESTEKKILIDVEVKATDALKNLAQMQDYFTEPYTDVERCVSGFLMDAIEEEVRDVNDSGED